MKNFTPHQPKLYFRQKRVGHPKLGKNSTNSDLAQTFRVTSDQLKIVIGGKKNYPQPSAKTQFYAKIQPTQINIKFSE